MDFPNVSFQPLVNMASEFLIDQGGLATAVYPTANLAIFIPFRIQAPYIVRSLFLANGGVVSGNIDLGIYSELGTKLVSTGSTAQAGTSALQIIAITELLMTPGKYYMAGVIDNVTATTTQRVTTVINQRLAGLAQMAAAFPLPATAVFAAVANAYVPLMGHASITTGY